MKLLIPITAALLIILFTYTALEKLSNIEAFGDALSKMVMLRSQANFITYAIPVTELAISMLLFFPQTRAAGLWSSLVLLTAFTVYLAVMVLSGDKLPCSCGGVISQLSWRQHILFNAFFIGLTALALYTTRRSRKPVNRVGNPLFTS